MSTDDGPFRVTAPTDLAGGRYVSNLVSLQVMASTASQGSASGGTSPTFTVSGQVNAATTFDINALQSLPAVTETVGANVYTGVRLWDLLNSVGLTLPAVKNPSLSMYAVATGSDGYQALVSLGEINPSFGNNGTIVAYALNGGDLGANGTARLIIPADVGHGRWVSNLTAIDVFALGGS